MKDNQALITNHNDFRDKIEIFFRENTNKVKLLKDLDKYIKDMVRFGFLKQIGSDNDESEAVTYEVKRIIKSRITSDKLEEFKSKLQKISEEA